MNKIIRVLLLVMLISLIQGCKSSADREIDITESTLEIQIDRFEKQVFEMDKVDSISVNKLKEKYQDLFRVYVERILNFGSINDPALPMYLDHYASDIAVKKLYEAVDTSFRDLSSEQHSITNGFKRLQKVFPKQKIPKIATFVNGFNYYNGTVLPKKVFVTDSYVAMGLDMYLGVDFPIYSKLGFPKYFLKTMQRENLVEDLFKGYICTEFFESDQIPQELIYRMIYEGRMLYFIKQLIPTESFEGICGFTKEQLIWCENNEAQIWNTLVSNQLLYEKSAVKVDPFFQDGPFTKDFPKESPAKSAVWLGYKIVEKYMENNKNEIATLMKVKKMKSIFVSSKYKPN